MSGIRAIKAQRRDEGIRLLRTAAEHLARCGAKTIVMGCTEIPIALAGQDVGVALVDPTLALAKACISWARVAKE
jgi:aspartate racemase